MIKVAQPTFTGVRFVWHKEIKVIQYMKHYIFQ